jgi:hypothetical protein
MIMAVQRMGRVARHRFRPGVVQVTELESPSECLDESSYGYDIPYATWCRFEARRIEAKRRVAAYVVHDPDTRCIAVFTEQL